MLVRHMTAELNLWSGSIDCLLMGFQSVPGFQKPTVGEGIWWRCCASWQVCLSARAAMATVHRVAAAPLARRHPNLPRLKPGPDWMRSLMPPADSCSCSKKQQYIPTFSSHADLMEVYADMSMAYFPLTCCNASFNMPQLH